MDEAHLMAAVRYVENNPVAARMVDRAEHRAWSSARSHITGQRAADDPLIDVPALGRHVRNWRALLGHGLEAADIDAHDEAVADAIEARLRPGRPLAADPWIERKEATIGRRLRPEKRGSKPKGGDPGIPIREFRCIEGAISCIK